MAADLLKIGREMATNLADEEKVSRWIWQGIDFRNPFWVFLALGVMVVAIIWGNDWFLRYVHVASGILLTGADIGETSHCPI